MAADRWEQVFTLFDAARSRPQVERAAFLAGECGEDAPLREDVESLLAAHDDAAGFLSRPPLRSSDLSAVHAATVSPGLTPGRRLGAFEIERFLGAGGMGEVYRARDTRLDRQVAIKVLLPEAASDPQGRVRFAYEARAIARLSHPRICGLHDMGHHDGIDFLVMEYIEGETLASRLRRGPMPLAAAILTAVDIAQALSAAHAHGIVHRDLKPGNVMLTEGGAKLLDFGLARLRPRDTAGPSTTDGVGSGPMASGLIVGTLPYMAPEQLEGKEIDGRVDIFAFGAVLFEMLTGRKAFEGATQASVISAILSSDPPPIASLQPLSPPALERVTRTCLAKGRDDRWASAHDVLLQLEWIAQDRSAAAGPGPDAGSKRRRGRYVGWAAGLVVVTAVALGASQFWHPAPVAPFQVLFALPPQGATYASAEAPAISLDGRHLAFVGHDAAGRRLLYLRSLDGFAVAQALAGTDGASMPFWSPDSRALGFFAQGKLKRIDVATARIQTLADAAGARGGAWSRDDVILFVPRPGDGPYRVPAAGGDATRVEMGSNRPLGGWYPSFLPDGRHFLFFGTSPRQPEDAAVFVASLYSGTATKVVNARSGAVYAPPGRLLFWREGTLLAQAFDERTLQVRGNAAPVASAVGLNPLISQGLFSVSESGTLVFFAGVVGQSELVWLDRAGRRIGKAGPTGAFNSVSLSPDDRSVVYDHADPHTGSIDLWRLDFARGEPSRLTFHPAHDLFPLWSPDGARIAFTSLREPPPQLYELSADSAGNERVLLKTSLPTNPTGWSDDGRLLLYTSTDPQSGGDIWALPLTGAREPIPVLRTPADERYATLSPDGRWLAYISNVSGTYEVYVEAFPATGLKRQVSTRGGLEPQWRRDGRELFYLAPDQTMMSADVTSQAATLAFSAPRALFPTHIRWMEAQAVARHYGVARDGQSFLVSGATDEAQSTPLTVVLNWTTALGQ